MNEMLLAKKKPFELACEIGVSNIALHCVCIAHIVALRKRFVVTVYIIECYFIIALNRVFSARCDDMIGDSRFGMCSPIALHRIWFVEHLIN